MAESRYPCSVCDGYYCDGTAESHLCDDITEGESRAGPALPKGEMLAPAGVLPAFTLTENGND